jgi:hypothetical protein
MSLQQNLTVVIFILMVALAFWYMYTKFQDSERAYYTLYQRSQQLFNENQILRSRVKDLYSYKNDVSKTFKILDNELMLINDHLKKQVSDSNGESTDDQPPVSMLTPELLNSFFTNAFDFTSVQVPVEGTSAPNSRDDTDHDTVHVTDMMGSYTADGPAGSDPVGSDPVDSDPVGSDPVDSDPVGSDPVGTPAGIFTATVKYDLGLGPGGNGYEQFLI